MLNTTVLLLNLRAWPLRHEAYLKTLEGLADLVHSYPNCNLVFLNEFIYGKDRYYWKYLQRLLPEYFIVEPFGYNDENYKSATSSVLVKKLTFSKVQARSLGYTTEISDETDFSYLYNYLYIENDGNHFTCINTHCVQLSLLDNKPVEYKLKRVAKHNALWNAILNVIPAINDDSLLVMGDFNADMSDPKMQMIDAIVEDTFDGDASKAKYTYINPSGESKRYDLIFSNQGGKSIIDPKPLYEKWSDHAAVIYTAS